MSFSNTLMLEKSLGWSGILAEPARTYWQDLARNRNCYISRKCVWSRSGKELIFSETEDPVLSTLKSFKDSDFHSKARKNTTDYVVETISLIDLLESAGAPDQISFLSLDTEGSELEILQAFDFSKYHFRGITVEHNYGPNRVAMQSLLADNGYIQVLEQFSKFDDWYVSPRVSARIQAALGCDVG